MKSFTGLPYLSSGYINPKIKEFMGKEYHAKQSSKKNMSYHFSLSYITSKIIP